ncbi:MAG TPA: hypothetical protein DEA08_05400, partial [Planctomycetes bacterium]|nr:hypothetical protein [Planctomycetota bacterium]
MEASFVTRPQETRVALVLSGGLSLGSFSAGALAQTIELLDQHASAERGPLRLDVVAGTSAGAMLGAVLAHHLVSGASVAEIQDALADLAVRGAGVDYEPHDPRQLLPDPSGHHEPALLSGRALRSALERALRRSPSEFSGPPVSLAVDRIRLSFALTNLHGIDVSLPGERVAPSHRVDPAVDGTTSTRHDDRIRWRLGAPPESANPIDGRPLALGDGWEEVIQGALASAAAPGVFPPVTITRFRSEYGERWPRDLAREDSFRFTYVDGGVLLNEPLSEAIELARREDEGAPNAERWFVLIDPHVRGSKATRVLEADADWALVTEWGEAGDVTGYKLMERGYAGRLIAHLSRLGRVVKEQAALKAAEVCPAPPDGALEALEEIARDRGVPKVHRERARTVLDQQRRQAAPWIVAVTPESRDEPVPLASAFMGNLGGVFAKDWRGQDFQAGRRVADEVLRGVGRGGIGTPPDAPRLLAPDAPSRADALENRTRSFRDVAPAVRRRFLDAMRAHLRALARAGGAPSVVGGVLARAASEPLLKAACNPIEETRQIVVWLGGSSAEL